MGQWGHGTAEEQIKKCVATMKLYKKRGNEGKQRLVRAIMNGRVATSARYDFSYL